MSIKIISENEVWEALQEVKDPEIPTISIVDLGIVQNFEISENEITVKLTPTFSGCPAIHEMEKMVREQMEILGFEKINVSHTFDVQWTTERITEKGRQALLKHGLAPPPKDGYVELDVLNDMECPYCKSKNTTLKTPFGPTLCRAIHYCNNCLNAFESFKPVG